MSWEPVRCDNCGRIFTVQIDYSDTIVLPTDDGACPECDGVQFTPIRDETDERLNDGDDTGRATD